MHAGHGLGVVAAHVRQREPVVVEMPVELAQSHAGLDAHEVAGDLERPVQPVGLQQVAGGERDVRPRVAGADGTHGGAVVLGGAHDLAEVVERRRPVDPQRLDRLVARVVPPALALLEGTVTARRSRGIRRRPDSSARRRRSAGSGPSPRTARPGRFRSARARPPSARPSAVAGGLPRRASRARGRPGRAVPTSHAEWSEMTTSSVPYVHRIGGFGSRSAMPDQSQYFGDSALMIPRVPGATPGQCSDGVTSPG